MRGMAPAPPILAEPPLVTRRRRPSSPRRRGIATARACDAGYRPPSPEPAMPLPMLFTLFAAATPAIAALPTKTAGADALAPLAYFAGDWQCAGQFANGKPVRSRESFSVELGGQWLRMRHADAPPNRYLADSWWGYDKAAKRFSVTVF